MKHANVAIFVPNLGCPHRCSFCDQRAITGQAAPPRPEDVVSAVRIAQDSLGENSRFAQIAFFGGSFTAIERGYMLSLLKAAAPFVWDKRFAGIRISTRPDALDKEILALLKAYGVTAIELGAQSMDDRVLLLNRRGHTARQVEDAASLVRRSGFSLGLQMMTGLFGDTVQGAMETAEKLAALNPDTVRIYPALVMKNTELAQKYRAGEYRPTPLSEAVALCGGLLEFFEDRGIRVIRLGLHSTPELRQNLLAGPWHPAFRELCESGLFLKRLLAYLAAHDIPPGEITVAVNPRRVSRATGQNRQNLSALLSLGYRARIAADPNIEQNAFALRTKSESR